MTEKKGNGNELLDLISAGIEIPRLTGINGELLSIIHMPVEEIEIREVASLVESDPTLTATILRAANSAYFGALREIKTVTQAITRMGFEDTIHILSYQCLNGLTPTPKKLENFSVKVFWMHSWATAVVARMLGKTQYLLKSLPGELYTAGLLHDIGKIVIAAFKGSSFNQACMVAREQGIPIHEAEMQVMELDHAKVGSRVLDDWNLPLPIMNAVRFHHSLQVTVPSDSEIIRLIELADAIAYRCGFPDGTGQPAHDLMQTSIVKEVRGPLSSPKTLNRIFEEASAILAEKGRIIHKIDKSSQKNEEIGQVQTQEEIESAQSPNTPLARPPYMWQRVSGWARRLFGA